MITIASSRNPRRMRWHRIPTRDPIPLGRHAVPTLPMESISAWEHAPATCHPELPPATWNLPFTFAPLHRPQADLHFCT